MSNRVYETMTCVECCGFRVRVWRSATDGAGVPDQEILRVLGEEAWRDRDEIVAAVEAFAGVSAYEIVDVNGQGICVYMDWP